MFMASEVVKYRSSGMPSGAVLVRGGRVAPEPYSKGGQGGGGNRPPEATTEKYLYYDVHKH